MRLGCGLAIALCLMLQAPGMAARQQDPASSAQATAQAPAAPAPKEDAPAESAPAQKSPEETAPAKTPPPEQVPAETTPAASANPPTPAAEKKAPDDEAKKKMKAAPAGGTSARGPSASGTSSKGTRKHRKRTPAPNGAPRKIVVREGGATEPAAQIAPGMTLVEATRQRRDAEQWLASTGDQLKQLAERALDARQQETVGQIRNYMEGARSALQEGDVRRANTLALKAHLLAADLVKH